MIIPLGVSDGAFYESTNQIMQLLTLIFIFIFVIILAMLLTRFIVNHQKGASNAPNIEVVETYRLSTNKFVQIIRIGGKYLALAHGKDEVAFLAEIPPDELQLAAEGSGTMPDFAGFLTKFKNSFRDKEKEDNQDPDS